MRTPYAIEVAQLSPIRVTPFRWFLAKTEDGSLVLSGYVPNAETKAQLFALAGARALDATSIADGADETFAADAQVVLSLFALLDTGKAELSGTAWRITGAVADGEKASRIRELLAGAGFDDTRWKIDLTLPDPVVIATGDTAASVAQTPEADAVTEASESESPAPSVTEDAAPKPAQFSFAALLQNGRWMVGGNAPVEAFQRLVDIHLHTRTAGRLTIASAPEGFGGAALAALDLLNMLESGHLRYDGALWSLAGVAKDRAIAEQVRAGLESAGIVGAVAVAEPQPQTAANAGQSVSNADDATDAAPIAEPSDEPAVADAAAPAEAPDVGASQPAGAEAAPAAATPAIVETPKPAPIPELPLPTMHPFRWQAESGTGGAIDFSGYSPSESLKRYLGVKSHGGKDETILAGGAPDGFAGDVVAGLAALSSLDSGRLAFDGTGWTLDGSAKDDAAKSAILLALGERVDVWKVAIATPEPPPAPAPRPEPPVAVDRGAPDYVFGAIKQANGGIILSGDVPAEAMRSYLGVISGSDSTEGLIVREGAPPEFAQAAVAGVRALSGLESGKLVYKDFAWSFAGKSASAPARAAAQAQLAALNTSSNWSIDIVGPSPLEICAVEVAAFDERNAILFEAGSSRIAKESLPALDDIAVALKDCPEAFVHVEGHTDADGDDQSNLILSVARAEAVVDKMIELGISEARLYAIGYGESLPIASNDTNDGKRRNRRIVFTVADTPG